MIDTHLLLVALEDQSGETTYVLDSVSGNVIFISEFVLTETEKTAIYDQIDADPKRYVYVEPMASSDAYSIMADYVDQLPDSEAKAELTRALSRDRPFRRFKDALHDHGGIREKWHRYHEDRMVEIARAWLAAEGIAEPLRPIPGRSG